MEIRRVESFEVDGRHFKTKKEAMDHLESVASDYFRNMFIEAEVPMHSFIKFFELVLQKKNTITHLLTFDYSDEIY